MSDLLRPRTVLTSDGARLATYVREATGPTVVLSHGWTQNHRVWEPVVRRLADEPVRLVTWDQRGHGDSTFAGGLRRPQGESVRRLGADLSRVIEATADGSELVLGGHSMGGMTVMALAGTEPDLIAGRTRGVLLASTAMHGLRGRSLPLEAHLLRLARRVPLRVGQLTSVRQHRRIFGEDPRKEDLLACRAMGTQARVSTIAAFYSALMEHDESAAVAALGAVPVDVVVGTRDPLTPHKLSIALAEAIPGARLHVEQGAGHMTPFERADLLTDLLRRHLH